MDGYDFLTTRYKLLNPYNNQNHYNLVTRNGSRKDLIDEINKATKGKIIATDKSVGKNRVYLIDQKQYIDSL